jgi:hypothetical protein
VLRSDADNLVRGYYNSNIAEAQQNTPRQNWQLNTASMSARPRGQMSVECESPRIKAVDTRGRHEDLGRYGSTPPLVLEEIIHRRNNLSGVSLYASEVLREKTAVDRQALSHARQPRCRIQDFGAVENVHQ